MTAKRGRPPKIEELFEPTSSEQDFDDFIDDIGENGSTVEIYRIVRTEREHLDVETFDAIRADPYGYLRQRFGPGKYSLKFKSADRKYQGNKTLLVGSQVKLPDTPGGVLPIVAPAAPAPRDEFIEKMLLAMVAAQKPPDLGGMMNGLGTVLTAILAGTNRGGDPVAMFSAVTKAAADMKGPQKDEDWLDRVEKVVTIVKTLSPQPEAPDTVWGVIRDVGKEVVTRLALPAATQPGTAAVGAVEVQQQPPGGAMPHVNSQSDWVRMALSYLKSKAKQKKDAGLFVDFMFENQEEPQWNAVLGAVQHGATFEHLLQFDPEIGQNPELTAWFKILYDGIYTNISESVDTGGQSGNTDNADKNGGAGEGGPRPS